MTHVMENTVEKAKKVEMQTESTMKLAPIPKGKKAEEKILIQAEVNKELFSAAKKAMEKNGGVTNREIIEWAFSSYLMNENPSAAARFEIVKKNRV
jgi:glutathione peroxidase-family protein